MTMTDPYKYTIMWPQNVLAFVNLLLVIHSIKDIYNFSEQQQGQDASGSNLFMISLDKLGSITHVSVIISQKTPHGSLINQRKIPTHSFLFVVMAIPMF
jgi:hypothetical protein